MKLACSHKILFNFDYPDDFVFAKQFYHITEM